ncbi:hypothetical protein TMO_a0209 (plasmid) [Tistrella mobilis KA081020-065]|uniref:Uncharacterized protein n=1 Tax=Tistrella mobilis (strain KA081020-065) TaxID=1110502 RepID=I3TS74_TISMK|nr:hypothetical protein TMO_a0209 [Tistrella mobilis KA081020-065]
MASFNPRTRKGATGGTIARIGLGRVSIHAPARVRPEGFFERRRAPVVSIHAPARVRRFDS